MQPDYSQISSETYSTFQSSLKLDILDVEYGQWAFKLHPNIFIMSLLSLSLSFFLFIALINLSSDWTTT